MIVYSIIQKSQLEGAKRLDAEYFQPEYLELEQNLKQAHLTKIKDLGLSVDASAFYPSIAEYYGFTGEVPFVRVADVVNSQLVQDGLLFLPKRIVEQFKTIRIGKPGDIIITKGGTVGNATLLPNTYSEYALSRDIIYIKSSKLSEEQRISLLLFLNSKLGVFQLIRGASQQIQLHLTFPIIRELFVPKFPIKIAVDLYKMVLNEDARSRLFYQQAEDLLLGELGLKNFQVEDDLSFVVNLSDVKSANRVDAEYFQPKYEKLISKIKNKNAKRLRDFVASYSTGFPFKSDNYAENGIPLIRINNIKKGYLDLDDTAFLTEKDQMLSPKDVAKAGDIVLSMSGTIGMTAVIPEDISKCSVNQRILKFTPKGIDNDFFTLVLNSIVGLYQLQRIGTGGVQTNISYKDIKNVLVPNLPKITQQKIAELVRKSHEARKKSKELLEEAKRKVEEMIENG